LFLNDTHTHTVSLSLHSQTQGLKSEKDEVLDQNIKVSNYKNKKQKQKIMEKKMLKKKHPMNI
jgi:hypothetical protein